MELFEHCRGCARYLRSCTGMSKETCEQHDLRIPITNADRIRSMSDEELAKWVTSGIKSVLARCKGYELSQEFEQEMLDWLREEAK